MKPFSLEEYLKNPSRKVITRDGRNARIICTDAKNNYPIVALIERTDGSEYALSYTKDGKYINETTDNNDLFFAPEKHEGWINLYKNVMGHIFPSYMYQTEEEAKKCGRRIDSYVTTVKIDWEE